MSDERVESLGLIAVDSTQEDAHVGRVPYLADLGAELTRAIRGMNEGLGRQIAEEYTPVTPAMQQELGKHIVEREFAIANGTKSPDLEWLKGAAPRKSKLRDNDSRWTEQSEDYSPDL